MKCRSRLMGAMVGRIRDGGPPWVAAASSIEAALYSGQVGLPHVAGDWPDCS